MSDKAARPNTVKVKYPIGAKLVIIITILLLVSLGVITALVSVMVSNDVQVTAEDNNLTINQRSAAEVEATLTAVRSNALVLLETLNAAGGTSVFSRQASSLFFERNQSIAAIVITKGRRLVNDRFFASNEIDPSLIQTFLNAETESIERCSNGESLLLNAAPVFGIPVLALL